MRKGLWITADKREIPIKDLGDQHLVNILNMAETNLRGFTTASGTLPREHMNQYGALVAEAMRRGLFNWVTDRKYIKDITKQIKGYRRGH
jgi:hypothetical protein